MSTRLDRLVLLLDTGSTATVRQAAAKQLGLVQKQHPDELYPLLLRVVKHLNSSSWESRVAAGLAIQAICDNVPLWNPPTGSGVQEPLDVLSFDALDMNMVLENGRPLLASSGDEFDMDDWKDLDPKQRLALQKKRLMERLGLASQFMDVDFLLETDATIDTTKEVKKEKESVLSIVESSKAKSDKPEEDIFAGMSAREKNQLKRRMKQAAKNQGSSSAKYSNIQSSSKKRKGNEGSAVKVEEEIDPNRTVVAYKEKVDVSTLGVFSSGDEWPFEGLCEQLSFDLFSPKWETRHGAAIGIRELIKTHGCGYGKVLGRSNLSFNCSIGLDKKTNEQRHNKCLEDLVIRLLCVLCLDRFADFVGDQAVVPVRETCSQALAVVLEHCTPDLCLTAMNKGLLVLINNQSTDMTQKWAVRHAALIGLKYWMAVRQDLVDKVLVPLEDGVDSPAFLAIVDGLKDSNDDVRAVASSALLPISDLLVKILPERKIFDSIVICLWDSLQDLDDLTAATSFVMDLLSDLLRKPSIGAILKSEASQFLEKLVPQLFPFFRHAITSVRLAVLRTISSLAELSQNGSAAKITWIAVDLFRLLFQNFVLEERHDVTNDSLRLWTDLSHLLYIKSTNPGYLETIVNSTLSILFAMIMSPIGTGLDNRLLISYSTSQGEAKRSHNVAGLNIPSQDRAMMNQDLTVLSFENVMHGRISGSIALGRMISDLMANTTIIGLRPKILEWITAYINSSWAFHRLLIAIVIQEWVDSSKKLNPDFLKFNEGSQTIWDLLVQMLTDANAGGTLYFMELQNQLRIVWNECTSISNALKNLQYNLPPIPPMISDGPPIESQLGPQFTIESADLFLNSFCSPIMANVNEHLIDLYRRALISLQTTKDLKKTLDTRIYSASAAAIVAMGVLPPKLNPIIRNLMNSIQTEEIEELQRRSGNGVARMIALNVQLGSKTAVNDKMIKNTSVFLCSDPDIVGLAKDAVDQSGIITLKKLQQIKPPPSKRGVSKKKAAAMEIDAAATEAVQDAAVGKVNEQEILSRRILHRGAESTIEYLCKQFGGQLFEKIPVLWGILSESLLSIGKNPTAIQPNDHSVQPLLDSLHVIHIVTKYIDSILYPQLLTLLEPIANCLTCPLPIVRNLASFAIAAMARFIKVPAMMVVISSVIPLTHHSTIDVDREGGVEALYHIVDYLDDDVLPYIIFLMAPLLGRMSDSNEQVRFISTNVFAQLVKLAPLEAGIPDPEGFTTELIEQKKKERKFIGQLIGTEKVVEFNLPVTVAAELRSYQKEGVSWLAFLNRYGMHGILCDDMGLGKTLQSICMIASDHYNREQLFKQTKSVDHAHCPSLIVCPSPLTGHWFFEIKKYADFLKSIIYIGDKNERLSLRRKLFDYDIVIVSYEVLRNDIDFFQTLRFNYCCLDEGHVIKNPSTKLTKSVKMVKAFHRLILSGTPVQNNVIDLWSLFDFLMPGFLGTESQFNERFGKPISASRDAKASSKEQEKGALALEALHKQVLPFLMRRMKEDVLEDLPPKIIQDYYCELSEVQKMLYDDFSQMAGDLTEGGDSEKQKGQHVFQALQYLKKLCNHPKFVLTPSHPQYNKVQAKLKADKSDINEIVHAPKILALQQLLLDCGIGIERQDAMDATSPHRVLIFAQVKQMLDMIQDDLFKKLMPSVTYMRLDGQMTDPIKRHELIQTFNQDPSIDVLLLTTHVGGLGLNLTGADTVIFMEHDWNPMKDLQAMDRAHRIGQKRVVNVYRLITKGTLEEKIMGLQKFKMNLSSSIINSDNSGISSMDTSQIIDLFSLESKDKDKKVKSNAKLSSKEALESLDQLWDEDQYDDLAVDDFLQGLQSRKS
ncbi:SNF2 family N-terminal domain-containing protein [Globomyces pollinis-pini]|nr:SNF2 family N-terminal domain-containing protein [Globomyces pollinis-pini]